ncbi:hypothetical protein HHK36_014026 [Tetracentron sinense]|uniref:2-oxoglutarate-dependent dioxygenase DAO n=1 Tax=Tetracentron sinense TaxID=13715 RepID=A0A835DF18_TETSI|nr:hypothetical protein HHK36_014026 [Tetracentron sinense]
MCNKVREACEQYGCFQVAYDKVSTHLHEEMFMGMKSLFDLPDEIKKKNSSPKPYRGYLTFDGSPLYESLGIEDATQLDAARAFTDLIWPEGNPNFCRILNSMSRKILELELIIQKMIFEAFGVEKYYDSHVENRGTILRVMKYKSPPSDVIGLLPHTDKNFLTILCQDKVGLQVLSKEGDWLQMTPAKGSFMVIVGEIFMAWSNGRFPAAKHRVVMRGGVERLSFGLFSNPKEGVVIEAPKEFVDDEHPLIFRPFNFMDFIHYFHSNHDENTLEIYAGV